MQVLGSPRSLLMNTSCGALLRELQVCLLLLLLLLWLGLLFLWRKERGSCFSLHFWVFLDISVIGFFSCLLWKNLPFCVDIICLHPLWVFTKPIICFVYLLFLVKEFTLLTLGFCSCIFLNYLSKDLLGFPWKLIFFSHLFTSVEFICSDFLKRGWGVL